MRFCVEGNQQREKGVFMINKMDFLRKIKKNRVLVLIISSFVICGVYFAVQKAIDVYAFNNNSDIVFGGEISDEGGGDVVDGDQKKSNGDVADSKSWFERLFGGEEDPSDEERENSDGISKGEVGEISEDEVDLVLEGADGLDEDGVVNESNVEGEAEGSDKRCKGKNICIYNWRN